MVSSTINPDVKYLSRDYAAVPNDIYYAVRAVFRDLDYTVNEENLFFRSDHIDLDADDLRLSLHAPL